MCVAGEQVRVNAGEGCGNDSGSGTKSTGPRPDRLGLHGADARARLHQRTADIQPAAGGGAGTACRRHPRPGGEGGGIARLPPFDRRLARPDHRSDGADRGYHHAEHAAQGDGAGRRRRRQAHLLREAAGADRFRGAGDGAGRRARRRGHRGRLQLPQEPDGEAGARDHRRAARSASCAASRACTPRTTWPTPTRPGPGGWTRPAAAAHWPISAATSSPWRAT